VKTIRTPTGALFECGPHTVRFQKSDLASKYSVSLMTELGLEHDVLFRHKDHPSAKYRYGMIDGKITKFPYSLASAIQFSKINKVAFLKGLVTHMEIDDDISMYDLIQKRFGDDAAKYLIDPMCRGIFGEIL